MHMSERRQNEIQLLERVYPEVSHDDAYSWIVVHKIPLGDGWNRNATDVLIVLEPGYPQTPPDNFYVPPGLTLSDGTQPGAFSKGGRKHAGMAWDQFSWHVENGWWPAADIEKGSNLLSFMQEVKRRLQEAS